MVDRTEMILNAEFLGLKMPVAGYDNSSAPVVDEVEPANQLIEAPILHARGNFEQEKW